MRVPRRLIPGAADSDILSREQSKDIIDRVIKMSTADAISVNVTSGLTNNIRFAANQLSTAGSVGDANVAVTSAFGAKRATVVTNNLTDEALRATVKQSEALAKLSPDDPEALPALGPQNIKTVNADFPSTEAINATELVQGALTALDPARKAGDLTAAGYQLGRHGADDAPTRRIPAGDDRIHERHGHGSQAVPARLPVHIDARPGIDFGKQQHDGLRQPMHLVILLPLFVLVPGRAILRGDGSGQRCEVDLTMAEHAGWDIHGSDSSRRRPRHRSRTLRI